ncbi:MAG: FGGY-family carbohydrate kinase, partial [Acidimicrobiales bacterium]
GVSIPGARTPAGSPGEVWNGVLAALAARTLDAAGRAEQLCGPSRRLVVFGGGSRSDPWLRAKQAAGFLPVVRSGAKEAVARGAALTAGVAAGWWPAPPTGLK